MPNKENVEELALQYLESDNPAKAVPYLIEAARQAGYQCANDTAIRHYRKALTLIPEHLHGQEEEFYKARIGLGKALKFNGDYNEAQGVFSETLDHLKNWKSGVESSFYTPNQIKILRELGDIRQREGAFDEALKYMGAGLDLLEDDSSEENFRLTQSIRDRVAWILFQQGKLEKSYEIAHAAIKSIESRETDPATLGSLRNTLGGICWKQGKLNEAITDIELSVKLYREINNPRGMGVAYTNLGILNDINGNWPRAIDYYERACTLQKSIGDLENQARSLDNLGVLRMAAGNHEATRKVLLSALDIRKKLGDKLGIANSRANLAQQALIENNFEEASRNAEMALKQAKKVGGKEIEVYARWILAMVQAETGDIEKGLTNAGQALQTAQSDGFKDEEIDCRRTVGILQARFGDFSAAKHSLQESIKLARKQMDPYREGLAHLELGRVLMNQYEKLEPKREHTRSNAADSIQDAIVIFESLGATLRLREVMVAKRKCME